MISANTTVHWIDIYRGTSDIKNVNDFFQAYSDKLTTSNIAEESIIDLSKENVKIHDLYGWTNVTYVKKKYISTNEWVEVLVNEIPLSVVMTADTLIAAYQSGDPVRGFHGEVKYPYKTRNISMIEDGDMIRITNKPSDDNDVMFFHPMVIQAFHKPKCAYEIYTKSGFYNAGGYHLLCNSGENFHTDLLYK